eukprot:scaffold3.g6299.t1
MVQVCVDRLQGCLPVYREAERRGAPVRPSALQVEARLCSYGEVLGIPARTQYAEADWSGASWCAWLSFPVKYRDLGHTAQLALTVWEVREGAPRRPLGGTTLRLFSKKGRLKTGGQELQLWPGQEADVRWPTSTPGKVPVAERGELGRVEQVLKRYERGEIPHVDWLDRLAMRTIDGLREQEAHEAAAAAAADAAGGGGDGAAIGPRLTLLLELPSFPRAVIFAQQAAPAAHAPAAPPGAAGGAVAEVSGGSGVGAAGAPPPGVAGAAGGSGSIILLSDPEVGRENPSELKAQKLARSLTRGLVDRALKPDTEERRAIAAVLAYPPNRPLAPEDRALLWRFRFALTSDPRALTKFLKCVDWGDASEARQAAELMQSWAPIDVADALELLSPDFTNEEVRSHAVEVLAKTDDDELLYYLLQLALRYEAGDDSRLSRFLLARARRSLALGSFLFWYLITEMQEDSSPFAPRAGAVHAALMSALARARPIEASIQQQFALMARLRHLAETVMGMGRTSARRADALKALLGPGGICADLAGLACPCPLDPSVQLLGLIPDECSVFKSALTPLKLAFRAQLPMVQAGSLHAASAASQDSLLQGSHEGRMASLTLASQHSDASLDGAGSGGGGSRRQSGGGGGAPASPRHAAPAHANPVAAALAAAEEAGQLSPDGGEVEAPAPTTVLRLIYKHGDDLRQDQLVVQMISLMDRLLKREHLDLRITPYQVLATFGPGAGRERCAGLIEFVPSTPLAIVLRECRTIHRFLAMHHPDPAGPFGLRGQDPKPFPPPMKLSREMIDAMGGADSPHYRQFTTLCCEAYNILRKSANLLLSLFHLMAGASIPTIQADPEKALLKLQERLRPELSDEGAAAWMQQLLGDSASALMPQLIETTHRWAQYWR